MAAANKQKAIPFAETGNAAPPRPVIIFRGLALPESSMMTH